jgi:signal transduction histidine kinase
MAAPAPVEKLDRSGPFAWIRAQDVIWFALVIVLAVFGPEASGLSETLLIGLGLFQVLEPRLPWFAGPVGAWAGVLFKLALCYLVIGFTGGISSSFYLLLLLPVVSSATRFGVVSTLLSALLACGAYLSFLLFIDWGRQFIPDDQIRELTLRVAFLPVVGFLTQQLAEENRRAARRAEVAARELSEANRSLQEAEAAVRRSDRLAALGQLTAGLAHELRNPLGTIRNSAELLSRSVPETNEVAREMSGYITAEVDRANSLVSRFLEFARPLQLQAEVTELHAVLDRAIDELGRHVPRLPVEVYKNYAPEIRPFAIDAQLMERVFFNLLLNAAQASSPGGAVTVKTRAADGVVEIAFIDRGRGIARKDIESIFNPFFTTKPDGVGLGLAIVSKIVDEHRGRIAVESEEGQGSVFRVLLPFGN